MKIEIKNKRYTLTKRILSLSWISFFLYVVLAYFLVPVSFFLMFPICDNNFSYDFNCLIYSFGAIVGTEKNIALSNMASVLLILEKSFGLILVSIFTAFLITKITQPRSKVYLGPRLAAYWDEGNKHIIEREKRFLLEFRLIVFPNPPLRRPEIMVDLYTTNKKGERDNIPLELTPVQASQVSAYLTFRAILPEGYLILPNEESLEPARKVPRGTIDVFIKAIDTGSDNPINIYKQYQLPDDVRSGSFKDAVILGDNDRIVGIQKENLEVISK